MKQINLSDIRLSCRDDGAGPPLLLIHGFPLDHSMWSGQMDDLAGDFRVLAPDLRGFGRSDVTQGVVTMQQLADDLAELLDAVGVTQPVLLCGLSMGGYVCWQFWRRHASRLRGLILCDTRAAADSPEAAAARRAGAQRVLAEGPEFLAQEMSQKLFAPTTVQRQAACIEATRHVILQTSPAGIAAALCGMADRPDATDLLAKIDLPALVVCGRHDAISTPDEMRGIAAGMPRAQFVEIEDAGHMSPLENPQAFNRALRNFAGQC
jgi:pimeloyl-ACP methyl ester carboxylesterase